MPRRLVVLAGLVSLAFAAGCGRDKAVFDAKLSDVKAAAMKSCAKQSLESISAELDQVNDGCERGFAAAERVARAQFADAISVGIEGGEVVTRLHLSPLETYLSSQIRLDGFDGSDWICMESAKKGAAPSQRETVDICRKGAREAFVELGRSCGVDIEKIAKGKTQACVIKREPVPAAAPMSGESVKITCNHGEMCP